MTPTSGRRSSMLTTSTAISRPLTVKPQRKLSSPWPVRSATAAEMPTPMRPAKASIGWPFWSTRQATKPTETTSGTSTASQTSFVVE